MDEGDPFTQLSLDKSFLIFAWRILKSWTNCKNRIFSGLKNNWYKSDWTTNREISAGVGVGTDGGTFAIMVKENNWLGEGKQVAFDFEVSNEQLKESLYMLILTMTY